MPTVHVLWWIVLGVAVAVLPLVVYLLHRTLTAARAIARYIREMREAGEGIAGHTTHITDLEHTIATGSTLLAAAGDIDAHAATIKEVLAARAARLS